ncbi:phage integrase family protein [Clostridium botulinum 202F]|uniref:Integrase/recombinase n=1 Tax=Clostridium botulinum TaxID=1491 RepID=R4NEF2_CLOBO|nr:integrase/recombinase [Clostridium botulinum]AIY79490.1 phage integrase family protein [Clostridium botulinum 202F]AGL45058.1 integrase/recombinase [Clostridium botulinum]AGL45098.1 integrase/recombinase [Clostridium botulinum]AGL45138.1 integrase/recombinase [Clostridium botulinum]
MSVEPIKDKKKIDSLLTYLKGKNERDYLLCKFQLNTGLRISDVVNVKVSDILTSNINFKDYFILREQKTSKEKKIKLNDTLKKSLKEYVKQNKLQQNDYIFKSRKGPNNHISPTQAYRILKSAAENLNIENFGTHSLRKSWGYWTYKASKYNIGLIMDTFNHSSEKITLKYIGIDQDAKGELYSLVQF